MTTEAVSQTDENAGNTSPVLGELTVAVSLREWSGSLDDEVPGSARPGQSVDWPSPPAVLEGFAAFSSEAARDSSPAIPEIGASAIGDGNFPADSIGAFSWPKLLASEISVVRKWADVLARKKTASPVEAADSFGSAGTLLAAVPDADSRPVSNVHQKITYYASLAIFVHVAAFALSLQFLSANVAPLETVDEEWVAVALDDPTAPASEPEVVAEHPIDKWVEPELVVPQNVDPPVESIFDSFKLRDAADAAAVPAPFASRVAKAASDARAEPTPEKTITKSQPPAAKRTPEATASKRLKRRDPSGKQEPIDKNQQSANTGTKSGKPPPPNFNEIASAYYNKLYKHLLKKGSLRAAELNQAEAMVVFFVINATGRVSSVRVENAKGDASVVSQIKAAVMRASPFPPIPGALGQQPLTVRAPVRFK